MYEYLEVASVIICHCQYSQTTTATHNHVTMQVITFMSFLQTSQLARLDIRHKSLQLDEMKTGKINKENRHEWTQPNAQRYVQNVYENKPKILTFNGDIWKWAPCYSSYDTYSHVWTSEKVWMELKMHLKLKCVLKTVSVYINLINLIPQWWCCRTHEHVTFYSK